MGASLCTFPAFSLGSTNAMVDNPRGGPQLLPFVAVYLGAFVRRYLQTGILLYLQQMVRLWIGEVVIPL